ncbi:2-methylcitrate dehydratase [Anatilimnocola aggregata]|uniref:2-methylcitrate dehydratase n=1 Tax=Anatilimnocola aggregata TaxID=2528021 RepID=A0A517Y8D5_9BACT|nr:MmgE/PrpD family protein [Anatilimnocola aggregata]QDU26486.1 2-methylcitrate dehydratase [Anatilimnocola aggregata]
MDSFLLLPRSTNQARGIGQYAIDFLASRWGEPTDEVLTRVEQFHTDSIACGVAALACGAPAPRILRDEALSYLTPQGVPLIGSTALVQPEKAVLANSAAVRELDSNGTNFGYNPRTGYTRGEFGHNDFYPVAIAAAQLAGLDGRQTLWAMLCLDEIRGRLAECYGLKDHKIDHVLHGGIASAAVYGAVLGATSEQIESAIGMVVAHYVPFRAIRHGHQLSDSKGASAAITAEVAVTSMRRAMRGFVGPADILRNPQAVFCLFEPTKKDESPFDLELGTAGSDFAIMGMHFKLGLYEHQSAGAIGGLIALLAQHPQLCTEWQRLERIRITIYEPAFSIIGDPHKRDPRTRQSADHSMVYIVATLLRKAIERATHVASPARPHDEITLWQDLMLLPADYDDAALVHPITRELMQRIEFVHGGSEYDQRYPDGIPTTIELVHAQQGSLGSGLVMYPQGHARCERTHLAALLANKFERLTENAVADGKGLYSRLSNLLEKTPEQIRMLYDFQLATVP